MEVFRKKTPLLCRNEGNCVAEFGGAGGAFVLNLAPWDLEKILHAL